MSDATDRLRSPLPARGYGNNTSWTARALFSPRGPLRKKVAADSRRIRGSRRSRVVSTSLSAAAARARYTYGLHSLAAARGCGKSGVLAGVMYLEARLSVMAAYLLKHCGSPLRRRPLLFLYTSLSYWAISALSGRLMASAPLSRRGSDDHVDRRPLRARDGSGHANGHPSAAETMAAHFETIEAREPSIRAWAFLSKDGAMEAAARADAALGGPARALARFMACRSRSRTSSTPPTCRPSSARLHAGRRPPRTRLSSPACARPARSSWARSSPPNTRCSCRARRETPMTYRDRREAPRWARRRPSPPLRHRRSPSPLRPKDRSSGRRRSAASWAINPALAYCPGPGSCGNRRCSTSRE